MIAEVGFERSSSIFVKELKLVARDIQVDQNKRHNGRVVQLLKAADGAKQSIAYACGGQTRKGCKLGSWLAQARLRQCQGEGKQHTLAVVNIVKINSPAKQRSAAEDALAVDPAPSMICEGGIVVGCKKLSQHLLNVVGDEACLAPQSIILSDSPPTTANLQEHAAWFREW